MSLGLDPGIMVYFTFANYTFVFVFATKKEELNSRVPSRG